MTDLFHHCLGAAVCQRCPEAWADPGQGGNKFNPLQKATRAEAVQLISKL
ncbi:hypothetical protein NYE33_34540 [Paenibacillus sp. FSL R10-2199]